jgi:Zn finger protein HypA/HybF involved in hydrogenase expression
MPMEHMAKMAMPHTGKMPVPLSEGSHMNEEQLAAEMFPQLEAVAVMRDLAWVTRVEIVVGSMHGVSAKELAEEFEHVFADTSFDDAVVEIVIVQPHEEIKAPGRDNMMIANGWELLITKMEGRK